MPSRSASRKRGMAIEIFIDGAAGTTGLEIRERLAGRPDIGIVVLGEAERKQPEARRQALNDADIVILCLPDEAAREAVALIANDRTKVIDASTAHRVAPGWTYGFPELERDAADRIAAATRVTNPGCYPTGFLALVRPLVRAGLIAAGTPLAVHAVSGYSGGGKGMIAEFEAADRPPAFRGYALDLAHKHVPEMTGHAGLSVPPIFMPAVVNAYRGMVVEVPLAGAPDLSAIEAALGDAYAGSPVVRVAADGAATIAIEADAGTDRLTLHVRGNPVAGQARLVATLDNLGKGAAGAAVQHLNIMAGLDQTAGLIL